MPVDYSKFDNIGDSDEEEQPAAQRVSQAATPMRGGGGGYPAPAPNSSTPAKKISSSGRELLEPTALQDRLTLAGPTTVSSGSRPPRAGGAAGNQSDAAMEMLAEQLERMAGGGGGAEEDKGNQKSKSNEPKKMCYKADGKKKIHTTFPDGGEMIEEYDEKTDLLLVRMVKKGTTLGKEAQWIYEVGQPPAAAFDPYADTLKASSSQPIFLRKDTPEHFQWRIRNLSYPSDVYSVKVDHEKQDIVVRTSNKKYFKRIDVPDLRRIGLTLKDESLDWVHKNNALIISYAKPKQVREAEQQALKEAEKSAVRM